LQQQQQQQQQNGKVSLFGVLGLFLANVTSECISFLINALLEENT
jgi:hypothetical protein